MKLVDVLDSKSCVGNHVPVRVRPSANKKLPFGSFLFAVVKTRIGQLLGSADLRTDGMK